MYGESMASRRIVLILAMVGAGALLAFGAHRLWIRQEHARLVATAYEAPPPGMVLVPAGEFLMGGSDSAAEPDEGPLRKVFVPAFYIDRCEVTNRRYKQFKPDFRYPAGADDLPVTGVLKKDAQAYCRFVGKRLPTGAEWEKAARGTDGRRYPWGDPFILTNANLRAGSTRFLPPDVACQISATNATTRGKLPVGSFPSGASPYGCLDMSGNVWEWVSDVWVDKGWSAPSPAMRRGIIRGGAYGYGPTQARTSYQGFEDLDTTCHDVGFRCAMDAIPKKRTD